ncbi:MAG: GNAT family N-acetyltransferase [Jatrophihabitans sp.]
MPDADVSLCPLDEPMLERLVAAAVADADPNEVIPPVPGSVGWDAAARDRLRAMHRDARSGLDGPGGEETHAVAVAGEPVGAIRLKHVAGGAMETGMWLTRGARGRGAGTAALRAIVERARALGAQSVVADTSADNSAAQKALRSLGFNLDQPDPAGRVAARLTLS